MGRSESDKRGRAIEWRLAEQRQAGMERPAFDPTSSGAAQQRRLDHGVEILFGRVMDAIPYLNVYKVLPERGLSVLTCSYLSPGPNSAFGARSSMTIAPGARVWFIYHRELSYGLIIGVEPDFMTDGSLALSDFIYLGSRSGFHRDTAHSFPMRMNSRGLCDWSAGRPFDATTAGEWGAFTETGLRVMLDSGMVQLGAGESCGVFAYLWDQLLRVAGVNLQIRSSVFEHESLDDESEHFDVTGYSVYPWESLGGGRQSSELFRTHPAQDTEIDKPWYAAIEPKYDDQMALRRVYHFQGYLGQGGKRTLVAPTGGATARQGVPAPTVTLFEENIALTGRLSVRSAMGASIVRRPLIPKLQPKKRPEHKQGDNATNYKASGASGDGPQHVVSGAPSLPSDAEDQSQVLAAGVADLHAYTFNWEAPHPFHYHEQDWELSEEDGGPLGDKLPPIPFEKLAKHRSMYLPPPQTASVEIDHRYGTVAYALTSSHLTLLDDGGVSIGSGCGCELRMAGGSITLSAPGDVWIKPGRNAVTMAGRDLILRGKRHVDASSSEGDLRLKAERHLWGVAGNGGDGLMLLESRGTGNEYTFEDVDGRPMLGSDARASGVVLRAANSNVVAWGQDIYLRTGGGSVGDGDITLDASNGRQNILTNSESVVHYMTPGNEGGRYDAYHDDGKVKSTNTFISSNSLLHGSLAVIGSVAVDGSLYTNDWIYVDTGHIATADAPRFNYLVPGITPDSLQPYFDEIKAAERSVRQSLTNYYSQAIKEKYLTEYHAGNDRVMSIVEFSFRTTEQYGTGGGVFRLYEDRWQQLARLSETKTTVWTESLLVSQGQSSGPYPGYEVAAAEGSFRTLDLTMVDAATGTAKHRGSAAETADYYTDPKYATPVPGTLNNNYTVIG